MNSDADRWLHRRSNSETLMNSDGKLELIITVVEGIVFGSKKISVHSTDQKVTLKSKLNASERLDEVRLYFRERHLDEKFTVAQAELHNGDKILAVIPKPSIGPQKDSSLIDLKINGKVTVKIVDFFHETGIYLVADDTAYGIPVRFVGETKTSFDIKKVVSATYVGAMLDGDKLPIK